MTTICASDIDTPCPTCGLKPTTDNKCRKPRAPRSTPRNAKTPSEPKAEERAIDVTNAVSADDDVLTDRKMLNLWVKMVELGLKRADREWARPIVNQIGMIGLFTENRKTLAQVKLAGNVAIPSHVLERIVLVFRKAKRGSKATARSELFTNKRK